MSENYVIEVFVPPKGSTIQDCFHADIASQFVEVPDEVTAGSEKNDDGTWSIFIPPEPRPPQPEGIPPVVQENDEIV